MTTKQDQPSNVLIIVFITTEPINFSFNDQSFQSVNSILFGSNPIFEWDDNYPAKSNPNLYKVYKRGAFL